MKIGGLQRFSLLDYPGKISAIIFTQGCNFRCQFCYNPMLVEPQGAAGKLQITSSGYSGEEIKKGDSEIGEEALFDFLKKRAGKLDAVVVTGGEPTIHADLPEFVAKIKKIGFDVKLDSNGTNPEMLKKLVKSKLIDYIAMDVKAPPEKYHLVAGAEPCLQDVLESIKIIKESGLPYEFRTTLVPGLADMEDIKAMGEMIRGGKRWFLQQFKSDIDLVNNNYRGVNGFTDNDLEQMRQIASDYVEKCSIR